MYGQDRSKVHLEAHRRRTGWALPLRHGIVGRARFVAPVSPLLARRIRAGRNTDRPNRHTHNTARIERVVRSILSLIFMYESWPIPRPGKQATSPANPSHQIGQADGSDRAFPRHFAKKTSNLREINPQSKFLS